MSAEINKAIVRRMAEEVFNKGNLSMIPELVAPNYVYHTTPEYKAPKVSRITSLWYAKLSPTCI